MNFAISDESLQDFAKLNTNAERIRFILNLAKLANGLPLASEVKISKDNVKAKAIRLLGNEFFLRKDNFEALKQYNESLCYAVTDSEAMGIAYANRASVFLTTGHFEFCMDNIELALQHGCPSDMYEKLQKRKEDCLRLMEQNLVKQMRQVTLSDSTYTLPPLSHEPNEKIPFIVDCIELTKTEQRGRGLVTKKDLKPGDILILEEPFLKTLKEDRLYTHCFNCMQSNALNLKPIPDSNRVMYCSEKCYDEGWNQFMKYEAPIIDHVYQNYQRALIVIRHVILYFSTFGSADAVEQFIESIINNEPATAFDLDYESVTTKDFLRITYVLETMEKLRDTRNMLGRTYLCAFAYHLLVTFTKLGELIQTEKHEDLLMELLLRLNQISAINDYETYELDVNDVGRQTFKEKASGLYPITAYLNHSCASNVYRTGDVTNIIYVSVPIKAGEELYLSYGPLYTLWTKEMRKDYFWQNYFFDCECKACVNDYPLLDRLPLTINPPISIAVVVKKIQADGFKDKDFTRRALKMVNQFIADNERHIPSVILNSLIGIAKGATEALYLPDPSSKELMYKK